MNVLLKMLIILFGILHIADGIVTYFGLRFLDLEEVNPILTFCAEFIGLGYSIVLFKMAELGFIAFLFFDRHKMRSPWITATLASAVFFYSWVVTNNVSLVLDA